MPDKGCCAAFVEAQAGDHGRIIGITAVAMDFDKILNQVGDVVQGVRSLGMAGDLDDLGSRQPWGNPGPFFLYLGPEAGDLVFFAGVFGRLQAVDLLFKGENFFF